MQTVPLAASVLLLCFVACHRATLTDDALGEAGTATLTSAPLTTASDDQLASSIQDALEKNRIIEPQSGDVRVSNRGGVVTLQGHVDSAEAKQRITALVERTLGVTQVVDKLDAPQPNPSTANDAAITHAIQEHLAARQDDGVTVATVNATVVLEGSVPTEVQKVEIEAMAKDTPSVEAVDNRLVVRPLSKP